MADDKDNFTSFLVGLDPRTRACALVGRFLQLWAAMEATMNSAIGQSLGITPDRIDILAANVPLAQKVYILRCAAQMQRDTTERKDFVEMLGKILGQSEIRNMMAHSIFTQSDDGTGVWFGRFTAKEQLKYNHEEWDIQRFEQAYERLTRYRLGVQKYQKELEFREALIRQLLQPSAHTGGIFGHGLHPAHMSASTDMAPVIAALAEEQKKDKKD